ncbi:MAG: SMP-30/gluconolactonase/LRE family protein [Terriglobia bacterium]
MKSKATLVLGWVIFYSMTAFGQAQSTSASDTVAPAIPGVLAAGTKIQVVKEGFKNTEGPIALPDGSLIFTENVTNKIFKIDAAGNTSVFLEDTKGANALAFDPMGRLIATRREPGFQGIAVIYPKGRAAILADKIDGKPLDRPNDLVLDKKGGIYFTDPAPHTVYYVTPGGKTIQVADGFVRPNGIQLSPDDRVLYVNDTEDEHLVAFDVQPDGTLRNRRNFAKYVRVQKTAQGILSGADGMAIDSEGRIYTALNGGVDVYSPQGQLLGTIPVGTPGGRGPQNLAFAGRDKKTLYIAGRGAIFKVQTFAQGYMGRVK